MLPSISSGPEDTRSGPRTSPGCRRSDTATSQARPLYVYDPDIFARDEASRFAIRESPASCPRTGHGRRRDRGAEGGACAACGENRGAGAQHERHSAGGGGAGDPHFRSNGIGTVAFSSRRSIGRWRGGQHRQVVARERSDEDGGPGRGCRPCRPACAGRRDRPRAERSKPGQPSLDYYRPVGQGDAVEEDEDEAAGIAWSITASAPVDKEEHGGERSLLRREHRQRASPNLPRVSTRVVDRTEPPPCERVLPSWIVSPAVEPSTWPEPVAS